MDHDTLNTGITSDVVLLDVAIWTKFPPSFVDSKITPKLLKRGVRVVKTLTERTKESDLSSVAAVLYMHEYSGHKEFDHLRTIVGDKRIIAFSRKESFWNRDLKPLEDLRMAAPKAISDHNIPKFVDRYIELRNKGLSHADMVQQLSTFWENGKLTNAGQLSQYIRSLISTGRAPASLKKCVDQINKERKEKLFLKEQIVESGSSESSSDVSTSDVSTSDVSTSDVSVSIASETSGDQTSGDQTSGVQTSSSVPAIDVSVTRQESDIKILEELYAEEVNQLKKQIENQDAEMRELRSKLAALDGKSGSVPVTLDSVISNLIRSVDLDVFSKSVAFDHLRSFIERNQK